MLEQYFHWCHVWILGNLRLSGHQHEGGRILTLVDDVNDMC